MDLEAATRLGSFAFFAAERVPAMAAMMLPGEGPALVRRAHAGGERAVPLFLLPASAAIDVPVVLAIAGLGILINTAPSAVSALTSPM